jgi:hypothetical protein
LKYQTLPGNISDIGDMRHHIISEKNATGLTNRTIREHRMPAPAGNPWEIP